jgi:hypothetical protein
MIKPGYRSSEFWLTVVSFIFSGLYLIGLLEDNSQKEDLIAETSRGVEAVILVIGQLLVLYRYVKGRNELKKVWWDTASPEERKEANTRNARTKKTKPKKTKSSTLKGKNNVNNNS